MQSHQHLPDANRLSIVAAVILLAYALTPFVTLPERLISLQLPGFLFEMRLDFTTVVAVLVSLLAAAGTDWLIQTHPHLEGQVRLPHWLLPALTAWAIGVPLTTLEVGVEWWVVFALGGLLFILVMLAEYIVVDPQDIRHAPASIGLTAVSFALYLVLAVSVRAAELRLYTLLMILAPTLFLVSLRSLYLRSGGRWFISWAVGITLVVSQLAAGLHYLPLSPLRFGLVLLAVAYGVTSLAGGVEEGRAWKTVWIEPAVMMAVLVGLSLLVRA
ncbi:MAG: hypothetical protein AB1453_03045 [Chloroflexota bacterium]|jgi:hypothetical protein